MGFQLSLQEGEVAFDVFIGGGGEERVDDGVESGGGSWPGVEVKEASGIHEGGRTLQILILNTPGRGDINRGWTEAETSVSTVMVHRRSRAVSEW